MLIIASSLSKSQKIARDKGQWTWEKEYGTKRQGTKDKGQETQDMGHGTWDVGQETRVTGEGHGTRVIGHGTRDMGLDRGLRTRLVDGRMGGWTDGQMDRWTGGWTGGPTRRTGGRVDWQADGRMD